MKHIPLTQGKYALVDDDDYEWLMTWKWYAHKQRTGNYYVMTVTDRYMGRPMFMHRIIMMHPHKPLFVDHIDHNGLNNQRNNLRIVTHRGNLCNKSCQGVSDFPGVDLHAKTGSWRTRIRTGNSRVFLGYFKSQFNAALAYQIAKRWLT